VKKRLGKNTSKILKSSSKFSDFLSKLPIYGHFKTLYLMIETGYLLFNAFLIKTKGKTVI